MRFYRIPKPLPLWTQLTLPDHGLDIEIHEKTSKLTELLKPAFQPHDDHLIQQIPEYLTHGVHEKYPALNIVIQIVGSRGDVQPFVSLGKVLREKYDHRVRIATHFIFKSFVEENGLEFFNIGGDPAELMAFMVHNPGLIPDIATLRSGEVGKRRQGTHEMLVGCWRSCIEAGDGTGDPVFEGKRKLDDGQPFVADAIIANPPSFAHIHCAEKLGVPLHLMFTMPWSPTKSFPHPLVNIRSSNAHGDQTNFLSYALVEMMTWQGLGDVINKFRRTILNLTSISLMWAPGMNSRLRIPFTYCWSPALIPKPKDWGPYISISGFYFLSLASSFTPAPELLKFLADGPPPVYIGFGSIVVDDPDAMTTMIFSAVKKLGIRALVSKGWGGLGGDALEIPDNVFMLGNVPHDFLFQHVSAVVHHGGAGTTAAGIAAGRPTVVVPFFGDQPFWGKMIARAGAGPEPIPFKQLNVDNLVKQLEFALKPETLIRAKQLGEKMAQEDGAGEGAKLFHAHLGDEVRCSVLPDRSAVWRVKKADVKLSGLVATVLINEGLVDLNDLKLYRPREYQLEDGPWDPVSGVSSALIGTLGSLAMGVADLPTEFYHGLKSQIDNRSSRASFPGSTNGSLTALNSRDASATPLDKPNTDTASITNTFSNASTVTVKDSKLHNANMDAINNVKPSPELLAKIKKDEKGFVANPPTRTSTVLDRSHPTSPISPHQLIKHRPKHLTRSTAHAAEFLLKGPLDLFAALSGGFHNAPKLYGDTTVRHATPVSGFQSGLKAAGKDFALGIIDGVSGLVTQPVHGAKENGIAGALSGVVKGVGGLVLKPVGAVTGLPANLLKGMYKELEKSTDFCLQTHVMLSRVAQGLEDLRIVQERGGYETVEKEIIARWREEMRKADDAKNDITCAVTGKKHTCSHGFHFKRSRHMTFAESAIVAQEEGLRKTEVKPMARFLNHHSLRHKGSRVVEVAEENLMEGIDDRGSVVSGRSSISGEDSVGSKMEVHVGDGVLMRKHMSVHEMMHRLKKSYGVQDMIKSQDKA
ncbi:hypothetical protein BKA61DRAFT_485843 [Leptodontidium sp. MPI-SDFR-AT-0119]|nr:hypothetical protein BKA61DRAFT_485843 [Leptodontidium sp. MPI-SDFR-AT-0119]